jgi:bacteriocin-like protein
MKKQILSEQEMLKEQLETETNENSQLDEQELNTISGGYRDPLPTGKI